VTCGGALDPLVELDGHLWRDGRIRPPMPDEQFSAQPDERAEVGLCRIEQASELSIESHRVLRELEGTRVITRVVQDHIAQELLAKEILVGALTEIGSLRQYVAAKVEAPLSIRHWRQRAEEPLRPTPGQARITRATRERVTGIAGRSFGEAGGSDLAQSIDLRLREARVASGLFSAQQDLKIRLASQRTHDQPVIRAITCPDTALSLDDVVDGREVLGRNPVRLRSQDRLAVLDERHQQIA